MHAKLCSINFVADVQVKTSVQMPGLLNISWLDEIMIGVPWTFCSSQWIVFLLCLLSTSFILSKALKWSGDRSMVVDLRLSEANLRGQIGLGLSTFFQTI